MSPRIEKKYKERSRNLRKKQTWHETKLWRELRSRRFDGFKFRRQFVIEKYIVDFCCLEKKLIVELDGGGHGSKQQEEYDKKRDEYLKDQKFRVIRVWNVQLTEGFQEVLDFIYRELTTNLL